MAAFSYLDSSAIVKLVIREAESDAMETYMVGREAVMSSRLSETEVTRAARRFGARKPIQGVEQHVREAFDALFLHDVDADVIRRASLVDPVGLKALDAVHLATAITIGEPELEFVTYDQRLARAAEAAGLRVVQPGMRTQDARSERTPTRSR